MATVTKQVWVDGVVDFDADEPRCIRIFKSKKAAFTQDYRQCHVMLMDYALAVQSIRHQIWLRSQGRCEICDSPVREDTGQMHERKHRGQGGEISLANSVFICPSCHRQEHADRNPRWSKKT